jgi:hypothetical protein
MIWAFGTNSCQTNPPGKRPVRSVQLPLLRSNPNTPTAEGSLRKNKRPLKECLVRNVSIVQGNAIALEPLVINVLAGAHECSQRVSG